MTHHTMGLHDRGGEHLLEGRGTVLVTEAIGCDPQDGSGRDYMDLERQGLAVIGRLNNGYAPGGTIPHSESYERFAARCAHFVAASRGCHTWIIGNEPNLARERPSGQVITPALYAVCFTRCRRAIRAVQPGAVVVPAPVGPWNTQTGDWLEYQRAVLAAVECDAVAVHTYGPHGEHWMASMPGRRYGFWSYRDLLGAIPEGKRTLPVYLTEMNPNRPWHDDLSDAAWVEHAYAEIDAWNRAGGQRIHCAVLYRWSRDDEYHIDGKPGPQLGLVRAVRAGYAVPEEGTTMTTVRLWRRSMGGTRVDSIEVEEYLRGVVPAEMYATWHPEALRAQAVAARTYTMHAIRSPRHRDVGADLCDTPHCQAWQSAQYAATSAAVNGTAGITWPDNDCEYVAKCGRADCIHCQGQPGTNGRTWPTRMCQHGAQAMASAGASWREILAHYYGGEAVDPALLARARARRIRINPDAGLRKAIHSAGQEMGSDEWAEEGAAYQWGYEDAAGMWHLWRWTPAGGAEAVYREAVERA